MRISSSGNSDKLDTNNVRRNAGLAQKPRKQPARQQNGGGHRGKADGKLLRYLGCKSTKLGLAKRTAFFATRLLISVPSQGSYDIEIRDFTGKVLQSIGPNSVVHSQSNPTPGAVAFWSNRLPAAILKVRVDGLSENQDVKLLEYEAMPAGAKPPFYSVKGNEPYWFDAYSSSFDDTIKAEADSVGMLVTSEGSSYSGFRNWCCSGSIVSTKPRLLFMTNFHCGGTAGAVEDYWSDDVCHHTIVDFSWDGDTMITGVRIASFQQQKRARIGTNC
ncbi:hypothetical protein ACCS71_16430 [Rhizobium ruizarguesonis]|jgi:hypothetical protein